MIDGECDPRNLNGLAFVLPSNRDCRVVFPRSVRLSSTRSLFFANMMQKLWRKLADYYLGFHQFAIDSDLLPSHGNYMKFIILGRSRTGSNYLRGLLNSCSGVRVFGEVFKNPEKIEWGIDGYRESNRARDQYLTDPAAFLQSEVFGKRSVDIRAVGFKLFYYHAQTEPWNGIWASLLSDRTVHILHMKRKNILRTILSRIRAGETDAWVRLSDNEEQPMLRVHLSYQDCLSEFVQTRQQEQEFDLLFSEHPLLEISMRNCPKIILLNSAEFRNSWDYPRRMSGRRRTNNPGIRSITQSSITRNSKQKLPTLPGQHSSKSDSV